MADQFIRVRLLRITGVDLNHYEFDWDLTWAAFFINGQEKILGRFGGRDPKGPDTRNSLAGLRYAMQSVLAEHRKDPGAQPEGKRLAPKRIEDVPIAKRVKNGCIHCHQAKELMRMQAIEDGVWQKDSVFTYPLPENIGITLERDRGDRIQAVIANSLADKAGVKAGDRVVFVDGRPIHSFADFQYALHKSPWAGSLTVAHERDGQVRQAKMDLPKDWKRTNITWRPSLLDLLPSLTVYGDDLTAAEKKAAGLSEKRLAFRQDKQVHSEAKAMGVESGDIIVGVNGLSLELTVDEFLAYMRRNFLVGDRVVLNVLRSGRSVDLPIVLK